MREAVVQVDVGLAMPLQGWYADDAQAAGRLEQLRNWWDLLVKHGPAYGYYPKPSKTVLVVKRDQHVAAQRIFMGTGIRVKAGGARALRNST